jgi:hypothetical protein
MRGEGVKAMRVSRRDIVATTFVLAGALVYVLWLTSHPLPGMSSARVVAFVVLGTGVAASASAVVPSFMSLLHGSKTYLAVTSSIGTLAAVAGVVAVVRQTDVMLGVLVSTMAVLWIIATVRHMMMTTARDSARLSPKTTAM